MIDSRVLETHRLRLRRIVSGDEQLILEMLSDDEAMRFFHSLANQEGARQWVTRNRERYAEDGLGLWIVELRDSGEAVGDCGLTYQEVDGQRELEVGYHLIARHRGHGYATEAATACVRYGFRHTGAARICSLVHPTNLASARVAARVHPLRRECVRNGGKYWMHYSLRSGPPM